MEISELEVVRPGQTLALYVIIGNSTSCFGGNIILDQADRLQPYTAQAIITQHRILTQLKVGRNKQVNSAR